MAEKFDEFLEEVENDIRQEKYMDLWRKYGKIATNSLVGVLCMVAAYSVWSNYEFKKRQQAADKYVAAQQLITQGNLDQAQSVLKELAQESVKAYPSMAQFVLAGTFVQKGGDENLAQAQKLYEKLVTTASEQIWREFAQYQVFSVRLHKEPQITDELLKQIKDFSEAQTPLKPLAQELLGMALLKRDNKTEAAEVFIKLAQDKQAPEGLAMRAQLMTQMLSAQS